MSLMMEYRTELGLVRGTWVGVDARNRPLVRWEGGPHEPKVAWVALGAIPPGTELPAGGMPALLLLGLCPGEAPILAALLAESLPRPAIPARLELEAKEGVVIRCGQGRLEIDQEGAVTVRGRTILSRAAGTHRIKGGSVQIN